MSTTIFSYNSGFTQVDNDIFYVQSAVSASAFSVLIRIYRATQGYGVAVKALSGTYLQKSTNLSKNTVSKAVKELEELGVLLVKRRARLSALYQVSIKGVSKVCAEVKSSFNEELENLSLELEEQDIPEENFDVVVEKPETLTSTDTSFEIFWGRYDKKVGKDITKIAWSKLRATDHKDIMNHLEDYVKSTPEKQFRKDPINYLKDKVWQDEVVERVSSVSKPAVNKTQQSPSFSAPVEVTREVIQEGTEADAKVQAFLRSFGKKGVTYA